MNDSEWIALCKDWLARNTARLDQLQKKYENQFPVLSPETNLKRMDDLEVQRFGIEINRWELEETIKDLDYEEDDESD